MFYPTVTPPPVVTCCVTGYAFVVSDIGFTGNGGDSWEVHYPLTPVSVQSTGSIVGFMWGWMFWQNGDEVAINSGYATADHTITIGGLGAGVYIVAMEYEFSDNILYILYQYYEVDASGNIIRSFAVRGTELIGSIDCRTFEARGYTSGSNATLDGEVWGLGIVDTATLTVAQDGPHNYVGTLPEYQMMHLSYSVELDYVNEWGGHLTLGSSAVYAHNEMRTNCLAQ